MKHREERRLSCEGGQRRPVEAVASSCSRSFAQRGVLQMLNTTNGGVEEEGEEEGEGNVSMDMGCRPDHSSPSGLFSRLYSCVRFAFQPSMIRRTMPITLYPTCRPMYLPGQRRERLKHLWAPMWASHTCRACFPRPVPQDVVVVVTAV